MKHKLSEIIYDCKAIKFDTNEQLVQFVNSNKFFPTLAQKKYGIAESNTVIKFMAGGVYYTHNQSFNTSIHHSEIDMSC